MKTFFRKMSCFNWLIVVAYATYFWLLLSGMRKSSISSLWFLEPLLYLFFILGLWLNERFQIRTRIKTFRAAPALSFILFSWIVSMLFELSLTEGAKGGYGGFHEKTLRSFLLAQGFYIPFAVLGLWVIRHYHLTLRDTFFVSAIASVYETTLVGYSALSSRFSYVYVMPLVCIYYLLVYGIFLALPLTLIDERLLWKPRDTQEPKEKRMRLKIASGLAISLASWIIQGLWAQALSHLIVGYL